MIRMPARRAPKRRLTPEQVRKVRLSMASPRELASVYGIAVNSVGNIRNGTNYGPLRPDEREAQRKRTEPPSLIPRLEEYMLLVGPMRPLRGRPDLAETLDLVACLEASGECVHGRLPSDRTVPCGCWPGLEAEVVVLPVEDPVESNLRSAA